MGCDIHFHVEKRNSNGIWVSQDEWVTDDGYLHVKKEMFGNRNYSLFAILADVRNGDGFGDRSNRYNPISQPRGLPDNVSPEVKKASDEFGCDGHSHTHIALREFLDFAWAQENTRHFTLKANEFFEWKYFNYARGEMPNSYAQGIWGPKITTVSVEEMQRLIEELKSENFQEWKKAIEEKLNDYVTRTSMQQPYYKCAREFLSDTIPQLLALSQSYQYDDVRCVFWFDN